MPRSKVAVVRVRPDHVLDDIDRLHELAGVQHALKAGAQTILKDNISWHFPFPGASPYTDDRQHAVSLAYVVPVTGTCDPRQDALEITWMTPEEAASDAVSADMEGGRGALLRAALASVGVLP